MTEGRAARTVSHARTGVTRPHVPRVAAYGFRSTYTQHDAFVCWDHVGLRVVLLV